MELTRRLYIYFVSAVALAALTLGLANLLALAFQLAGDVGERQVLLTGSSDAVRREVSVYAALCLVALPVWLLHWGYAERAAQRDEAERRAGLRAVYLALGLALPFPFWFDRALDLVRRLVEALAATHGAGAVAVADAGAVLLTTGAVWTLHAWTRRRDERAGALTGVAAWAPRLYRYGAAGVGLAWLVAGVAQLLDLLVDVLWTPRADLIDGERWWAGPLAGGVARAVIGLLVWGSHWDVSGRLTRAPSWRGASERSSGLRRMFLYAALLAGALGVLLTLSQALERVLREALAVAPADVGFGERLTALALRLLPFAALWLYHRQRALAEGGVSASRVYTYSVALLGLLLTGVGLARVLGVTLDATLSGGADTLSGDDAWRRTLSRFAALALVGAVAWLWHWRAAQQRLAREPRGERGAWARRFYLYGSLAGAVVALLVSLAVVLYRALAAVLDVTESGRFLEHVGAPLGVALVAGMIAAFHGQLLRGELAAEPRAAAPATVTLALALHGPAAGDADAVLTALRAQLPAGWELRNEG